MSLGEIIDAVAKYHGTVTFVTFPEAEEFRRSQAFEASSRSSLAIVAEGP